MALDLDKYQVMSAVSSLGFEVFRNGSFHWNSSKTPDMKINDDGSIHCWTTTPFKDYTSNHGGLIDFIQIVNVDMDFKEAQKEAYKLLNLELPPLDTYKGYLNNTNKSKKTSFISDDFTKNFEVQRLKNFDRYKKLLNETLVSLDFTTQKALAKKYEIGYSKASDRLIMPIRNEDNKILTFWKYNKNPKPFINKDGQEVILPKVLFSRNKERCPFNLQEFLEFKKDKTTSKYLTAGEKDTLNLLGHNKQALTLGSENVLIEEKYLNHFKDLNIVVAYDNDKYGVLGSYKVAEQLENIANSVKIWNWEEVARVQNLNLKQGYDMTDYLFDIKEKNLEFNTSNLEIKQFKDYETAKNYYKEKELKNSSKKQLNRPFQLNKNTDTKELARC
jgi:DNA primase